jgi:hypothetical protein
MTLEIAGELLGEASAFDRIQRRHALQQSVIAEIARGIVAPGLDEGGDLQPRALRQRRQLRHAIGVVLGM